MYVPAHFEETDPATLRALLAAHPLATWATVHGGLPVVNHVPMRLDPTRGPLGTLVGHVARANPLWQQPAPSVLVFQGVQAYISPSWYAAKREHGQVVPTWNYAVVHVHGLPQFVHEREPLRAIVERLTDTHEAGRAAPWQVADAPADYIDKMLGAIVGVEIPVDRWVGKWKLSQNRSGADRDGVRAGLAAELEADARAMAPQVRPGG